MLARSTDNDQTWPVGGNPSNGASKSVWGNLANYVTPTYEQVFNVGTAAGYTLHFASLFPMSAPAANTLRAGYTAAYLIGGVGWFGKTFAKNSADAEHSNDAGKDSNQAKSEESSNVFSDIYNAARSVGSTVYDTAYAVADFGWRTARLAYGATKMVAKGTYNTILFLDATAQNINRAAEIAANPGAAAREATNNLASNVNQAVADTANSVSASAQQMSSNAVQNASSYASDVQKSVLETAKDLSGSVSDTANSLSASAHQISDDAVRQVSSYANDVQESVLETARGASESLSGATSTMQGYFSGWTVDFGAYRDSAMKAVREVAEKTLAEEKTVQTERSISETRTGPEATKQESASNKVLDLAETNAGSADVHSVSDDFPAKPPILQPDHDDSQGKVIRLSTDAAPAKPANANIKLQSDIVEDFDSSDLEMPGWDVNNDSNFNSGEENIMPDNGQTEDKYRPDDDIIYDQRPRVRGVGLG